MFFGLESHREQLKLFQLFKIYQFFRVAEAAPVHALKKKKQKKKRKRSNRVEKKTEANKEEQHSTESKRVHTREAKTRERCCATFNSQAPCTAPAHREHFPHVENGNLSIGISNI